MKSIFFPMVLVVEYTALGEKGFKYLHTISKQVDVNVVTLKEAPSTGHTIPRLELCNAVLAT